MKIQTSEFIFYVLFFFITSCIGIKNNKHNAVFQHIPTEIDDVVIAKFQNRPCYLRFLDGKNGWIVFIMR
jgi:hypothetical protein